MMGKGIMKKKHPNEIVKLKHYEYLQHADAKAESTIRRAEKAIDQYEKFTRRADFRTFNMDDALRFKKHLENSVATDSSAVSTLSLLRYFFKWLSQQPGYRKSINPSHADFFKLTNRATRAAKSQIEKPFPNLVQVIAAISAMPAKTDVEIRDRAILTTVAITGIRVDALISLKLKHFDLKRMLFIQDPSEVSTKFRKLINTFVFPLDRDLERIVLDWIDHLQKIPSVTPDSPLFPKVDIGLNDEGCFSNLGLSLEHWATTTPIRKIFKTAFSSIGEAYYNPHSFRKMIVSEAYRRKLPANELKAWSQNLGHEEMLTTLTSYGKIPLQEQEILIRNARNGNAGSEFVTHREMEELLRIVRA